MSDELRLYFVACSDNGDGENCDWFVTARTSVEAFAIWRAECLFMDKDPLPDLEDYAEHGVSVFEVPALLPVPGFVLWPHETRKDLPFNYEDLATRAIEAARKTNTADKED